MMKNSLGLVKEVMQISEGDKRLQVRSEADFFAKFGAREAENARLSEADLLKRLGLKGLNNLTLA